MINNKQSHHLFSRKINLVVAVTQKKVTKLKIYQHHSVVPNKYAAAAAAGRYHCYLPSFSAYMPTFWSLSRFSCNRFLYAG